MRAAVCRWLSQQPMPVQISQLAADLFWQQCGRCCNSLDSACARTHPVEVMWQLICRFRLATMCSMCLLQADLKDLTSLPATMVGIHTVIDCATARPEENAQKVDWDGKVGLIQCAQVSAMLLYKCTCCPGA